MSGRWTARGGWTIEAIALDGRPCYRVSRHGFLLSDGYCYDLPDLQRLLERHGVGLSDLTEDNPDGE